jgi:hypothetical protein
MMRGELVIVIFFVVAIALVSGFLTVALMFPELLPWYSGPSQRSSPPASTFWEESVAQNESGNSRRGPWPLGQPNACLSATLTCSNRFRCSVKGAQDA